MVMSDKVSYVDVIKYTLFGLAMMIMVLLSLIFIRIYTYANTLYYSIVLLFIVLSLLFILVSNLLMNTLTMLLLIIVYVGAMIILIGYICAVCPNLNLTPIPINKFIYLSFLFLSFTFYNLLPLFTLDMKFSPIVSYFYTSSGSVVFFTLVFILFVTLLMVTSQYLTPKGPFRSVQI